MQHNSIATYVNKWLSHLRSSFQSNIINYYNINIVAFHNDQDINFIINVYLDSNQIALYVLQSGIKNIENTLVMTGDFNIRDSDWDPNFHYYSIYSKDLSTIANSLELKLFLLTNPSLTKYANNPQDTNSVLDLVFLVPNNPVSWLGKMAKLLFIFLFVS